MKCCCLSVEGHFFEAAAAILSKKLWKILIMHKQAGKFDNIAPLANDGKTISPKN